VCDIPDETETILDWNAVGTVVWLYSLSPQHERFPEVFIAHVCDIPDETETILDWNVVGTVVWP